MATNTPTLPVSVKQPSHKASVTGGVLSLVGLAMAGIGSFLIHADYHTKEPLKGTAEKTADAVASGTAHIFSSLIGVPFLVISFPLAGLAIIFTVLRLRKVKVGGLLLSIVWILLSIWTFSIAINAFDLIKAH